MVNTNEDVEGLSITKFKEMLNSMTHEELRRVKISAYDYINEETLKIKDIDFVNGEFCININMDEDIW